MAKAYRLILDQLIARGFSPPRAPVHLPRLKFVLIVLRNLFQGPGLISAQPDAVCC